MYVIKRHRLNKAENEILDLVNRALLDRLNQRLHHPARMHRSPWVSMERAMRLADDKATKAVLMQIFHWMKADGQLGEAEENLNYLQDRFAYGNQTGIGYRNDDGDFLKHAKRLPNGDYVVDGWRSSCAR